MSTTAPIPNTYATVEDFELRLGHTLDANGRGRAQALLDDASILVRACAGVTWDIDDPDNQPPEIVRTIVLNIAARAWHNPEGVRQQTLGDLSMTFGSIETGVVMSEEECALIRKVAGLTGEFHSIALTNHYGWGLPY